MNINTLVVRYGCLTKLRAIPRKSWLYCQSIKMCSDSPVKYSVSKAAHWKAEYTRRGTQYFDAPRYQTHIVCASLTIFLIYFCVLRQENDIDELLNVSLYDRIEGLEETQLQASLSYNEEKGLDTVIIRQRLKELQDTYKKMN